MAHVKKFKQSGLANLVGHYARKSERFGGFRRENIDPGRTDINYAIGADSPDALAAAVVRAVSESRTNHERTSGRAVRKDANVLCDWVVTLPEDCGPECAPQFFATAVEFCRERYGAENVPGGFVHLDERTPHVHIPVVPLVDGRLQASRLIGRADLKTFHKDLSDAEELALGFHVSVELGEAQEGLRQLSALSQDEYVAARAALDRTREELAAADERLESHRRLGEKGKVELGLIAARGGAGERERAAEEENRRLKEELGRLEEEQRGEEAQAVGLGERLRAAWVRLIGASAHFRVWFGELPDRLSWVFSALGILPENAELRRGAYVGREVAADWTGGLDLPLEVAVAREETGVDAAPGTPSAGRAAHLPVLDGWDR